MDTRRHRSSEIFKAARIVPLQVGDTVETCSERVGRVISVRGLEVGVSMQDTRQVEHFSAGNLRYVPTPRDIVLKCAEIQRGWSERDFYSRLMIRNPEAEIPLWMPDEFEAAMSA